MTRQDARMRDGLRADLLMLEAKAVAVEHVLWAAEDRQTPRQLLSAVGIDWPQRREPDWEDCVRGIAIIWHRLKLADALASHRSFRRAA